MRILYFHQYFATPAESGGTRSYEFAKRLAAQGHSVTVVTSQAAMRKGSSAGTMRFEVDGIDVVALDVDYQQSMSTMRRKLAFAEFAFRSSSAARKLAADIVVATSTPLTIAVPGAVSARQKRIPLVLEVRDLWPRVPIAMGALRNPISRATAHVLEKWAYRSAQHIVALSPGIAKGITDSGVPASKVSMIPNGCDIDLFKSTSAQRFESRASLGLLESDVLVLYAGSFGKANRVEYLVRIAEKVKDSNPSIQFLLVGSGSEFDNVTHLAFERRVLGENVQIRYSVPKRDVVRFFSAADIVTSIFAPLPELRDNSANKFFDGLAAGRAVAVNHEGWQADILEQECAGVVLDADPCMAAVQLVKFSSDRAALDTAGARAFELAETRFSRDAHARQFESILQDQYRIATGASGVGET